MKFRKKPVVIEAALYTENTRAAMERVAKELHTTLGTKLSISGYDPNLQLNVHTLEGTLHAQPGDWIIKGIEGELYPCKASVFDATYEVVEE